MNKNIDLEFASRLCDLSHCKVIMESNYVKHGNFVIIDYQRNKVYKIYNLKSWHTESIYKFNWAYENVKHFKIPKIINDYSLNSKFIIEFELLEKVKVSNTENLLQSFYKLYKEVELLGTQNKNILYTDMYELKEQYEKVFESKDYILTHGDLNHKNIFLSDNHSVAVIDWDNLSFQPRELVETTTCLYFLSHPELHNNNFTYYFDQVLKRFSTIRINKLIELTEKKMLMSVTINSKNYWSYMLEKIKTCGDNDE